MVVPSRHEPSGGGPLPVLSAGGGQYATSEAVLEESWRHPAPASYEPPSTSPSAAGSSAWAAATAATMATTMTWQGQQPASSSHTPSSPSASEPSVPSSVQFASARAEKRALRAMMVPQNVLEGGPVRSAATSTAGPGSEAPSGARHYDNLPTTELVRILNDRLQPGSEVSAIESPPVYEEVGRR